MTDELTTADDLTEGQIVIDTQEDIEIEVTQTGDTFVLENEHGRSEATRAEITQLIELNAIRARTEDEAVDSILDNLGDGVDDETAWELAAGPSGKEDEIRNYPTGGR
jgi:hypothetical protein